MVVRRPECKDCKAERERRGAPFPKQPRPIVKDSGGRCASHNLQRKRLSRSGAHERRVQKVYGLMPGWYGRLYLHQGKVCAICRRSTGATRRLSVDHDHKTGLVRGLLCRPCNDFLGWIRDDPGAGAMLTRYLIRPPAVELDIVAVHEDFRKEEDTG